MKVKMAEAGAQLGQHAKGARQAGEPADDGDGHAELDGAAAANGVALGHGVDVLCADEHVQALDKGVVEDEHDGRGPPRPLVAPEEHLAQVAHVAHLGVAQAKLPQHQARVEHHGGHDDGQDQARHQPEEAVGPGEAHDGQADVLAEEQRRRLLPAAGAVLDRRAVLGRQLPVEDGLARLLAVGAALVLDPRRQRRDARAHGHALPAEQRRHARRRLVVAAAARVIEVPGVGPGGAGRCLFRHGDGGGGGGGGDVWGKDRRTETSVV